VRFPRKETFVRAYFALHRLQILIVQCSSQIFSMLKLTWQRLLSENLRKTTTTEALVSNYLDLAASMDNSVSRQECTKAKMEPYLETCYSQNNSTTMCDIPFTSASNNMLYCSDSMHRSNIRTTDIKYGNMDKHNYKSIRKWKRLGKDKDC
jgi:hypothetical protein